MKKKEDNLEISQMATRRYSKKANTDNNVRHTNTNRTTVTHGRPKTKNKGHNNCGPKTHMNG